GTAPRPEGGIDPATDARATALAASGKDGAEHVMIVDLMRNDLGRVSDYGSIWWDDAPRVEPHAGVWHLVSRVGGRLHEGLGDRDLLRATFPPGSVTGAPKVQAMRVISAVEGTAREVYTGAHGLLSPVAGLELAVTIRTIELSGDRAWIGAGGGIVADSVPGAELSEALGKASALVTAAGGRLAMAGPPPALTTAPVWMRSADRRPDPARGVLDTLRVEDGRALHLGPHLARIRASLRALGHPPAPDDLEARVTQLAATAVTPGRLRVLATPGARSSPEATIELQLIPIMATGVGTGPVALAPAIVPGGIGPHKYLDRDLIDALTTRVGATPLLLDAGGAVLEAGWANIWWLDDDGLATTPLDGRILPGITRGVLLQRSDRSPVPIREATIGFDAIRDHPLLLTSSRGVSVARLATTSPDALDRATTLARALAPLVADDG
ncbi:MAG: chorismate-binding protein, partial [Solirubrobacteraceae bacterium]|nr:chorismate-binding protein [Solirubrobacteraceae bacterium]